MPFLLCHAEVAAQVFDFSPQPSALCPWIQSGVIDCCCVCYVVDMVSSMFNQCFLSSVLLEDGSGCLCLLSSHYGCNRILVFRVEADDMFI